MAVGVKVVARPGSLKQQMYLPAIAEGMGITFRHFMKNWVGNMFGRRDKTDIVTVEYPEEKRPYPDRHRGLHRLMLREDGQVRCVACMLCAEACPCDAIRMDTKEHAKPTERRVDAILDKEQLLSRGIKSSATQGGVGSFWREKVSGESQTPLAGEVSPPGPPPGPTEPKTP